jgi:hypothetical protein
MVVDYHFAERSHKEEDLEDGVHVASISLVSDAHKPILLLPFSIQLNLDGQIFVEVQLQLQIFNEATPVFAFLVL